jgi:hypothetical protein
MTIACAAPDADLGIAIGCRPFSIARARALGENGFEALAGGPIAAGLLSGLVTIFVALIGLSAPLGANPLLARWCWSGGPLGFVLALATTWPAYQALFLPCRGGRTRRTGQPSCAHHGHPARASMHVFRPPTIPCAWVLCPLLSQADRLQLGPARGSPNRPQPARTRSRSRPVWGSLRRPRPRLCS